MLPSRSLAMPLVTASSTEVGKRYKLRPARLERSQAGQGASSDRGGVTRTPQAGLEGANTEPPSVRSFRENSDTRHGGGGRGGGRRYGRGHPGLRERVQPGQRRRFRADRQHRR